VKKGEETMKRHLVIVAALAALVLPGRVGAEAEQAVSLDAMAAPVERRWVDAGDLANLLKQKGLITPEEKRSLTHPAGAPAVDQKRWEEMFGLEGYRGE
jgi:hypothetical protein